MPAAGVAFEAEFMAFDLERQIAHCAYYELSEYFEK
jgi:hypothetical protein